MTENPDGGQYDFVEQQRTRAGRAHTASVINTIVRT